MTFRQSKKGKIALSQGYKIGYEIFNPQAKGKIIVLTNGSLFNYHQWKNPLKYGFFRELEKDTKILRYDYGGTGISLREPFSWSIESLSAELLEVLDLLDLKQVHLYGISKGTILNQHFAWKHPNRVLSLAGYGWFHYGYSEMQKSVAFFEERVGHFKKLSHKPPSPLTWEDFLQLWEDVYRLVITRRHKPSKNVWVTKLMEAIVKRQVYKLLAPTPLRVMYDWFRYAVEMMPKAQALFEPAYEILAQKPLLIQHATRDGTLPFGMAKELHSRLPHSHLISYDPPYHHVSVMVNKSHARQIARDYAKFLRSV